MKNRQRKKNIKKDFLSLVEAFNLPFGIYSPTEDLSKLNGKDSTLIIEDPNKFTINYKKNYSIIKKESK